MQMGRENNPTTTTRTSSLRLIRACLAGLVGITVNTVVLKMGPMLRIHPGSGGLLQLFLLYAARWSPSILPVAHRLGLQKPPTLFGFLWFHYLSGLAMILIYFFVFVPSMHRPRWMIVASFSILVWFVNAAFVLPQIGEGFAGIENVPFSGILYFFIANWIFVAVSDFSLKKFSADTLPRERH